MKAYDRPKLKAFFDEKVVCLIALFWQVCMLLYWQFIVCLTPTTFWQLNKNGFAFLRGRLYSSAFRQFVKYYLRDEIRVEHKNIFATAWLELSTVQSRQSKTVLHLDNYFKNAFTFSCLLVDNAKKKMTLFLATAECNVTSKLNMTFEEHNA